MPQTITLNEKQLVKFVESTQAAQVAAQEANRVIARARELEKAANDIIELILDSAGVEVPAGADVSFDQETRSLVVGDAPKFENGIRSDARVPNIEAPAEADEVPAEESATQGEW